MAAVRASLGETRLRYEALHQIYLHSFDCHVPKPDRGLEFVASSFLINQTATIQSMAVSDSLGERAPSTEGKPSFWRFWNDHVAAFVVAALILGILAGIFFGEYCAFLSFIGDAFVGLLRMTVLPFIATSLIANLGRLSLHKTRRLAVVGGGVLLLLWGLTLCVIFFLPSALPASDGGSFFSMAMIDPATKLDILSLFVPSNIFTALANNHVPAIVLFCICMGAALATIPNREAMISQLQVASTVLLRVAGFITKLAPIGVFSIAASTAGTISLDEAGRLQAYLILYSFGAFLLGFVIFPLLVTSFTPLTYRQLWRIAREPMVTAFATGKLIIVLPMLIQNTERLLSETNHLSKEERQELELLYATAYAFPHAGKLLSMLFIPFVSWFFGNEMKSVEYPAFLLSGVASYFGGPLIAIPFLLDEMHLPHDMFQLFLLAGVAGERVGDAVGVMHLVALVLMTLAVLRGLLDNVLMAAGKFLATSILCTLLVIVMAGNVLERSSGSIESKAEVLANIQLIESPVDSIVITTPSPNPVTRRPGETVIERIRRRGIMRIGFNEDKLPFAFFNVEKELVGFDVNLAHALARDLGVSIEFVRFDRATLVDQLRADHFDFVMSGLAGTLERSEAMQHSNSYMDVNLGLVVPDYRVREFKSLKTIREIESLRIGLVDLSRGFVARLKQALPDAELIVIRNNRDFFEDEDLSLDALLISAESGSAFTLLYPNHEVTIPRQLEVKLPLFYAISGREDGETRSFLNHWIELRQKDGTFREYYEHWILGKSQRAPEPRWSVIRNVLHWVH